MQIRKAEQQDHAQIADIIRLVLEQGDSYVFYAHRPAEEMLAYWLGKDRHTYVCLDQGQVAGTFYLKENQPDRGRHVANAGYMVHPSFSGRGIGRQMGLWSMEEARALGFTAMQFNFVVSTNTRAVRLWQQLGFVICGEVPHAFEHPAGGLVSVYIMHRELMT